MEKIVVKTDEALFMDWQDSTKKLERAISTIRHLGGIVQNDMILTKEDLLNYKEEFNKALNELTNAGADTITDLGALYMRTIDHIRECTLEDMRKEKE